MAQQKCKHERRSDEAELALAEAAFREALRGGDSAADAFSYGVLVAESARLDGPGGPA